MGGYDDLEERLFNRQERAAVALAGELRLLDAARWGTSGIARGTTKEALEKSGKLGMARAKAVSGHLKFREDAAKKTKEILKNLKEQVKNREISANDYIERRDALLNSTKRLRNTEAIQWRTHGGIDLNPEFAVPNSYAGSLFDRGINARP